MKKKCKAQKKGKNKKKIWTKKKERKKKKKHVAWGKLQCFPTPFRVVVNIKKIFHDANFKI